MNKRMFWCHVFIAAIRSGMSVDHATIIADQGLQELHNHRDILNERPVGRRMMDEDENEDA
jgi:hypothetical protein